VEDRLAHPAASARPRLFGPRVAEDGDALFERKTKGILNKLSLVRS
jgi:hypothetical protein